MLFFFAIFVNKYSTKRCTEIPCYFCSFCYSFQLAVLDIQVLITSNNFHRLCLFTFCNANLDLNTSISVFLFLFKLKIQCLYIFKDPCIDCFQYKISSVWSYIFFLLNGAQARSQNKTAAKQNDIHGNKKPRVFTDEPPSANKTFFGVVIATLRWLASLHCLLYFLAFDWLRPAVLFFLNWTVCLFVKESPVWNYLN